MEKRKLIIILLIVSLMVLISLTLLYTYAIDISMNETSGDSDLTFQIDINDTTGRNITVNAGKTKVFDIYITNNNNGKIKYGLAYKESTKSGLKVYKLNSSSAETSGILNKSESKIITLVIENMTSNNITYNIVPIAGYENGGNLIVPTNYTLISESYGDFNVTLTSTNATIEGGTNLTNLVKSGNFENSGWNGCVYDTEYKKYGNYSCKITGIKSWPEALVTTTYEIPLDASHIYYSRVEGYQTSKTGNQGWSTYWPIAEPSFGGVPFGEPKKWNMYSLVTSRTTFTNGNYQFRYDYDNQNNEGIVYYDGGVLLDLTESYGTGKTPSKQWLDKNVAFFEGSISHKVNNVNKNNSVTFTVTPKSGYKIDSVTCDNTNDITISGNNITINHVTNNLSCNVNTKSQ